MSVTRRTYIDGAEFARDAVELLIEEAAAAIESKAVARAPRDTNNLADAIYSDVQSPTYAEVVSPVEYAVYQEFGTRFQPGTPYMRPAVDEFRSQLKRQWKKAAERSYASNKR